METNRVCRRQIYGALQRIIHAWIALTLTGLVALGWVNKFMDMGDLHRAFTHLHITLGWALSLGFIARLLLGIGGPEPARLSALWRSGARLWSVRGKAPEVEESLPFGHVPSASIAYLGLYGLVLSAAITGAILAAMHYDRGPLASRWFDDMVWHDLILQIHDLVLYGSTLFIMSHFVGMIRHESKTGLPVAQAMISGYQYRSTKGDKV